MAQESTLVMSQASEQGDASYSKGDRWAAKSSQLIALLDIPGVAHLKRLELVSSFLDAVYHEGRLDGVTQVDQGIRALMAKKS